ncbi:hypothetical protein CTKA_02937 [Chthonomonas calidirosea]|uniref:Uncharacterized protein n=1 Tax=Chthonomonas calidirosea (strain DSM 23976 / ICMP 18418 / T49) TaxID=1303518 RepID=S0EYK3_CHTCT|nr:hypothetical protein [Chthonomonas calidirosea]CCW34983.1 hypothetical protein CCALI_01164 [Chthonomonas calidirosea T49]CEK21002.1 hypothetical protein CTKA_02937 [Chthonomonas calidirosea]
MKRQVNKATIMLVLLCFSAGMVSADILGSLLKAGGVAFVISKFGPQINSAIDHLTRTPQNNPNYATKVVPVISAGDGTEVGGVQVMGPRSAVNKVQAVVQFEGRFSSIGLRIRGLVPVETKSIKNIRRIPGVGISGLLDIKL